ncbi:MAG: FHA domain-containing protein, partial [Polyangiaceae bacterium]
MARYRLRFLLQEFDLPRGATLIGRSSDCHVTIEDPLVSREHARIVIDDEGARCEDLGSRNGVKINGVTARGTTRLKDGDRLRIGTQELVFCTVVAAATTP